MPFKYMFILFTSAYVYAVRIAAPLASVEFKFGYFGGIEICHYFMTDHHPGGRVVAFWLPF